MNPTNGRILTTSLIAGILDKTVTGSKFRRRNREYAHVLREGLTGE